MSDSNFFFHPLFGGNCSGECIVNDDIEEIKVELGEIRKEIKAMRFEISLSDKEKEIVQQVAKRMEAAKEKQLWDIIAGETIICK